jgi:hypothetical protein
LNPKPGHSSAFGWLLYSKVTVLSLLGAAGKTGLAGNQNNNKTFFKF